VNPRAEKVIRSTWEQSRGYFPGRKREAAPVVRVLRKLPGGGLAQASPGRPDLGIDINRALMKTLASKNVQRRKLGQTHIAHDLAHLFQDADTQAAGDRRMEGGAEAFARRFGKKHLGLTAEHLRPQYYSNVAKKFRRRQGMGEVMKGQFDPRI
jgi:hypothetical protein